MRKAGLGPTCTYDPTTRRWTLTVQTDRVHATAVVKTNLGSYRVKFLKATLETARGMRSVRGFAERVCLELDAASDGPEHENPLSGIEGDGLDE